jgi:hypothetical protein
MRTMPISDDMWKAACACLILGYIAGIATGMLIMVLAAALR